MALNLKVPTIMMVIVSMMMKMNIKVMMMKMNIENDNVDDVDDDDDVVVDDYHYLEEDRASPYHLPRSASHRFSAFASPRTWAF